MKGNGNQDGLQRESSCDYPVTLCLNGRPCLVVGGGPVAERKVQGLLRSGACITVVAPEAVEAIASMGREDKLVWHQKRYEDGDARDQFLVMVAIDDPQVRENIVADAHRNGALVNVADVPELCDFFIPSSLRRGNLTVAVSTGGRSPALARRIRLQLEHSLGDEYAVQLEALGRIRKNLQRHLPGSAQRRRDFILKIIDSGMLVWLEEGRTDLFWIRVEELIDEALQRGDDDK